MKINVRNDIKHENTYGFRVKEIHKEEMQDKA